MAKLISVRGNHRETVIRAIGRGVLMKRINWNVDRGSLIKRGSRVAAATAAAARPVKVTRCAFDRRSIINRSHCPSGARVLYPFLTVFRGTRLRYVASIKPSHDVRAITRVTSRASALIFVEPYTRPVLRRYACFKRDNFRRERVLR